MRKMKQIFSIFVCGYLLCGVGVPTLGAADSIEKGIGFRRYSERLSWHIRSRTEGLSNKEYLGFSRELKQEGDDFYRKKDYYHAMRKYEDARIYLPSPEIMFLIGDAKMRLALSASKSNSLYVPGNRCWPEYAFAYEVNYEIIREYYELGFDLADQFNMSSLKNGKMYSQVMRTSTCLQRLAIDSTGRGVLENPQACVDLKAVEACMGSPLLSK